MFAEVKAGVQTCHSYADRRKSCLFAGHLPGSQMQVLLRQRDR